MTLNLNLQNWKLILQLCDKSEKCPLPWPSVSRDSLLANFKRRVSRQLKSCNPFLPSFLAAAAGILRKLLKTHLAVCPHTCTEMPPNANTVYFEHPFKPKCTQTEIVTVSICWPQIWSEFYDWECITEKTGKSEVYLISRFEAKVGRLPLFTKILTTFVYQGREGVYSKNTMSVWMYYHVCIVVFLCFCSFKDILSLNIYMWIVLMWLNVTFELTSSLHNTFSLPFHPWPLVSNRPLYTLCVKMVQCQIGVGFKLVSVSNCSWSFSKYQRASILLAL